MLKDLTPGSRLPSIEKTINQKKMNQWARISGDYNRLHVDPEYAGKTPFKGTIAHGPMSLAFLNELMMKCFDEGWAVGGKLFGVRFVSPVKDGDRIRIGGVITGIVETEGRRLVECDLFVEKEDGTKTVVGCGMARLL
jgi:3-hydroxybutyryl-CoA dehydratase